MAITLEQLASPTLYSGGQPHPRYTPEGVYSCPQCGGRVYEDNWPPNMETWMEGNGGRMISGYKKCVCLACVIQFEMKYYENSLTSIMKVNSDGSSEAIPTAPRKDWAEDIKPLTEREGKYMTDMDVWEDDYFKEHGKRPNLQYG